MQFGVNIVQRFGLRSCLVWYGNNYSGRVVSGSCFLFRMSPYRLKAQRPAVLTQAFLLVFIRLFRQNWCLKSR